MLERFFKKLGVLMIEHKMVILVRQDLQLPKGKMSVQVAHAAVEAALKAPQDALKQWRQQGQKKVVLKVPDEKTLYKYTQLAKDEGITTAVITDAGKTVIAPGTVTCSAIGPAPEASIDRISGELQMM